MKALRFSAGLTTAFLSAFGALVAAPAGIAHASSAALPSGVYSGTIAGHEVVAELGPSFDERYKPDGKTSFGGEYYYRDHGVGILLEGRRNDDGSLTVREIASPGTPATTLSPSGDLWKLRASGGALNGTWTSGSGGKPYAIALGRVGAASQTADPQSDDGDLFHQTLLHYTLARRAPQTAGLGAYVTIGDTRFGLSGYQIVRAAPSAAIAATNRTLMADFDRRRFEAFDCLTTGRYAGSAGSYTENARIAYFGASVLTISRTIGTYCGGAHPNDAFVPLTLDLRNGNAVDWSRAIADAAGVAHAYTDGAPAALKKAGAPPECTDDQNPLPNPDGYAYAIVSNGLLVHAQLPHAVAACETDVTIASTDAKALLAPKVRALLP